MTMGLPCDSDGYDLRMEQCRQCGSRGCRKLHRCKDKDARFPKGWLAASIESQVPVAHGGAASKPETLIPNPKGNTNG